ncbi:MAG: hypothetical protein JOZ72_00610 [Alphaproteobacteria bacterium]|nr:hypothetical protein [Alphaproteobacteria bacterium]
MNKLTTLAVVSVAALLAWGPAAAATYKNLHGFCAKASCADGQQPRAGLAHDMAGNYFGTTTGGGAYNGGTVFRFSFDGTQWKYTLLHSFCRRPDCTDGYFPEAGVIVGQSGDLYGVTSAGGPANRGTLYKLSFVSGRWVFKLLHNFCSHASCTDGADPLYSGLAYQGQQSGALYDGTSTLYGTTNKGGANDEGTVFAFTPDAGNGKFGVAYHFCRRTECLDGAEPAAGVGVDAMGRIYGTALGGAMHVGVLYRLDKSGDRWMPTVLHDFCSDFDGTTCLDGMNPAAVPLIDGTDLYGTTAGDGEHDRGVAYKVAIGGTHPKFTVLHRFCALSRCSDGAIPLYGLTMDASGALFGTTLQGGFHDGGTLFELGGAKHDQFATLQVFRPRTGATPFGPLALGPSGELVGTLSGGGRKFGGVIYSLTP